MADKKSKTDQGNVEAQFQKLARTEAKELLNRLHAETTGLSDEERRKRLEQYGANDLSASQVRHWYWFLLHAFTDAFILVLLILGAVTYIVERDIVSSLIIFALACFSAMIRFVQD